MTRALAGLVTGCSASECADSPRNVTAVGDAVASVQALKAVTPVNVALRMPLLVDRVGAPPTGIQAPPL